MEDAVMSSKAIKLSARQIRAIARTDLRGKWAIFALSYLIVMIISMVSGFIPFATFLITGPVCIGVHTVAYKIASQYMFIEISDTFAGFKNFSTSVLVYLLNNLFIFLWSLLFFIPGIIKSYSYSMSYFVLAEHPEMSATEARKESIRLMRGNKLRLFCLEMSFIGWVLLSIVTCGISMFWVAPYIATARAVFYEEVKKAKRARRK